MNEHLKNCPYCNKEVDPLRAAAVSIVDGKITHFCSTACREAYLQRQPGLEGQVEKKNSRGMAAAIPVSSLGDEDASPLKTSPDSKKYKNGKPTAPTTSRLSSADNVQSRVAVNAPFIQLLWPFFVELGVLILLLGLVTSTRPHYLSGYIHLLWVGIGICFCFVWGVIREQKNGVSALLNTTTIPLASIGICVASLFGGAVHWPMAVALALPIIRSAGRCVELYSRQRSGVIGVVSGTQGDLIPKEWRDNSETALRIRKIAMVMDWARIPVAVIGGIGLWLGGVSTPGDAAMSSVIALIVLDPRLLRLITGDAHLKVALYAGRMGARIRDAAAVAQVAHSRILLLMAKETLVFPEVQIVDFNIRAGVNDTHVYGALAAIESSFTDRFATAIVEYCGDHLNRNVETAKANRVEGKGVFGDTPYGKVHCGSRMFMLENGISTCEEEVRANELEQSGRRVFFLALDGVLTAVWGIDEQVRPGVKRAVQRLLMMGFEPVMLTSAEVDSALAFGERIGIDNVKFNCGENELEDAISAVQAFGDKVTLIGNGTAFEQSVRSADCSVALGAKSPAGSLAGIDARGLELTGVAQLLEYTVAARKSVLRNLLVTLLLFSVGLCFALGWHSTFMALGMSVSVALVSIFNTLSGPYPFLKKCVAWCKHLGMKPVQMLGFAKRSNSNSSKK